MTNLRLSLLAAVLSLVMMAIGACVSDRQRPKELRLYLSLPEGNLLVTVPLPKDHRPGDWVRVRELEQLIGTAMEIDALYGIGSEAAGDAGHWVRDKEPSE